MPSLSNIKNIHQDVNSLEPSDPIEKEVWVRKGHKYVYNDGEWYNLFSDKVDYPKGTLWVCGYNNYGQLGLNDTIDRSSPVQVGTDNHYKNILINDTVSYAIKSDGTLWGCGDNRYGQLGQNDIINRSSPVQIGTDTNWSKNGCFLFIKTNGTLWGLGHNGYGQLGTNDIIYRSSPVQVGNDTNWKFCNCYSASSLAIKTDGTLWTWGLNSNGQLGQNDTVDRSSPVQVGTDTNWKNSNILIAYAFSAMKIDGTLWAWGHNSYGQLGQNDIINRSSPVQVGSDIKRMFFGSHSFLLKSDNTLWVCGYNKYGALGLNDTIDRSSPVQVGTDTNWKGPIGGGSYMFLCVKNDGQLWGWGCNDYGRLGLNDTIHRSSPVQIDAETNWQFISGYRNIFAIKGE